MKKISILWVDDEIDLLRAHVIFLEEKGYNVSSVNNASDAISMVSDQHFDLVFLDEHMPGMSGLEALTHIKSADPALPVVIITKSEEEDIMDQAIGAQIADYLIKPVSPKQIILSIKKNVEKRRLVAQKTTSDYQSRFSQLGMDINDCRNMEDWDRVYRRLVYWEMELSAAADSTMDEVLRMQKNEANLLFVRFIKKNYLSWMEMDDRPLMSAEIFPQKILPPLRNGDQVVMVVIDNLRYDQWLTLYPVISEYFILQDDSLYCSILPTVTQYARNSMFSGLMPLEIQRRYPQYWIHEDDDKEKNLYEEELLDRHRMKTRFHYQKVKNSKVGGKMLKNLSDILENQLCVFVYNFVDILSHARTELDMIRELANDEAAYRSLTLSWFEHSTLLELFKTLAQRKVKVVVTTDHGSIRVQNPIKVVGDRQTSSNLRYKQGKNLNYNPKEVFDVVTPGKAYLPQANVSSSFIFAQGEDFFAYPNNFNYYSSYYRDTFQHGGISLEEMMVPVMTLTPR